MLANLRPETIARMAALLLVAGTVWQSSDVAARAASTDTEASKSPPTLEEIKAARRTAREDLMLPSLEGIRGLAYGVVGVKESGPLENEMATKLNELSIPIFKFENVKEGTKPVDAILEIKVKKVGGVDVVDLLLTQWVSLIRSSKSHVRAVTYRNQEIVPSSRRDATVGAMSQQFVLDYLKANRKPAKGKEGSMEAKDGKESKQ